MKSSEIKKKNNDEKQQWVSTQINVMNKDCTCRDRCVAITSCVLFLFFGRFISCMKKLLHLQMCKLPVHFVSVFFSFLFVSLKFAFVFSLTLRLTEIIHQMIVKLFLTYIFFCWCVKRLKSQGKESTHSTKCPYRCNLRSGRS